MKRTIYIAVVNTVNKTSDGALCEVFSTRANADHWIGETISDAIRDGYTEEEMNTEIYEREIYL